MPLVFTDLQSDARIHVKPGVYLLYRAAKKLGSRRGFWNMVQFSRNEGG